MRQDPDGVEPGHARLLTALEQAAEAVGVRKLIAVIGDSDNVRSIGVHRAVGFRHAGKIEACGWKFDRWLDIILMEKALGEGSRSAPEAPAK